MDESLVFLWFMFMLFMMSSQNKPPIDPLEQNALYHLLNSINPTIPWTTLFPDDLCVTAPSFVVCESHRQQNQTSKSHIVELTFPPCSPNSTLDPSLFTPFPYLRKISFSNCFNNMHISLPSFPPSIQELVFIDNPSLVSPLEPFLRNLTSLKKLVLVGNGFYGELPTNIGSFHNLEQLNLSRNNLSGEVPTSIGMLEKLEILDLSHNDFKGCVPEQVGNLVNLLKLNLSQNGFACKIPESFIHLKKLEYLDLSFNRFGNFGVPLFLGKFHKMKELHLSGNSLSGKIPEIWKKLGGVEKVGFSKMDLVGEIPASMGIHLKNLSYLGLDNNNLEGPVPKEFRFLLKIANEINLENNNLSGRITFICGGGVGGNKLKLGGNVGLYVENKNDSCPGDVIFNGGSLQLFDPLVLVLLFIIFFVFT
ncbi:piriformospora indica-insensitive protein 2-like [Vicia villosa]|uniref:piriformospora indica-insensitive protein 2-like n=1 Tax=Vicia villosa TaxID=3911 RepID=UPI00273BAA9C|nr:piriformospora indica-insensitive protein 2-like [Vicia villosa]